MARESGVAVLMTASGCLIFS